MPIDPFTYSFDPLLQNVLFIQMWKKEKWNTATTKIYSSSKCEKRKKCDQESLDTGRKMEVSIRAK